MSLIDRSFEEVCSIMDHTGDAVDLLVEHATDFRMCDLLDENLPPGACGYSGQTPSGSPRKSGDGPVGLGLIQGKLQRTLKHKHTQNPHHLTNSISICGILESHFTNIMHDFSRSRKYG